jgi:hypothetical protein
MQDGLSRHLGQSAACWGRSGSSCSPEGVMMHQAASYMKSYLDQIEIESKQYIGRG